MPWNLNLPWSDVTADLGSALPCLSKTVTLDSGVPSPLVTIPSTTSLDRKSTRLNSSHVKISYAVFCLKKKKAHHQLATDGPHALSEHSPSRRLVLGAGLAS